MLLVFFGRSFDDKNLQRLRETMELEGDYEVKMFDFDSMNIDWEYYFYKIHIPGILKYACEPFQSRNHYNID